MTRQKNGSAAAKCRAGKTRECTSGQQMVKRLKRRYNSANQRGVTLLDKKVGDRLRTRRLEMHLSQTALGNCLGLSFQQIQKYEKGVNRVGAARLASIAGLLNTNVAYFVGDEGRPRHTSESDRFMATKEGIELAEIMLKLRTDLRRIVIDVARRLRDV